MDNIFELLEKLGVYTIFYRDDSVKFFDDDNETILYVKEEKNSRISKSKLEDRTFFTLHSHSPMKGKTVRIHYKKVDSKNDSFIVRGAYFSVDNDKGEEDEYYIDLDISNIDIKNNLKFQKLSKDNSCDAKLTIYNNSIYFEALGKRFLIDNGELINYDINLDNYDELLDEMKKILTNEYLEIFLNYYEDLYPSFKNTVETINEELNEKVR